MIYLSALFLVFFFHSLSACFYVATFFFYGEGARDIFLVVLIQEPTPVLSCSKMKKFRSECSLLMSIGFTLDVLFLFLHSFWRKRLSVLRSSRRRTRAEFLCFGFAKLEKRFSPLFFFVGVACFMQALFFFFLIERETRIYVPLRVSICMRDTYVELFSTMLNLFA